MRHDTPLLVLLLVATRPAAGASSDFVPKFKPTIDFDQVDMKELPFQYLPDKELTAFLDIVLDQEAGYGWGEGNSDVIKLPNGQLVYASADCQYSGCKPTVSLYRRTGKKLRAIKHRLLQLPDHVNRVVHGVAYDRLRLVDLPGSNGAQVLLLFETDATHGFNGVIDGKSTTFEPAGLLQWLAVVNLPDLTIALLTETSRVAPHSATQRAASCSVNQFQNDDLDGDGKRDIRLTASCADCDRAPAFCAPWQQPTATFFWRPATRRYEKAAAADQPRKP